MVGDLGVNMLLEAGFGEDKVVVMIKINVIMCVLGVAVLMSLGV